MIGQSALDYQHQAFNNSYCYSPARCASSTLWNIRWAVRILRRTNSLTTERSWWIAEHITELTKLDVSGPSPEGWLVVPLPSNKSLIFAYYKKIPNGSAVTSLKFIIHIPVKLITRNNSRHHRRFGITDSVAYRATKGSFLCLQKALVLAQGSLPSFSTTWTILCTYVIKLVQDTYKKWATEESQSSRTPDFMDKVIQAQKSQIVHNGMVDIYFLGNLVAGHTLLVFLPREMWNVKWEVVQNNAGFKPFFHIKLKAREKANHSPIS